MMIRANISDLLPIVYAFNLKGTSRTEELKEKYNFKQIINKSSIEAFKPQLHKSSWDIIRITKDPKKWLKKILENLAKLYNNFLPKAKT